MRALIIVDVQNDFCPGGALAVNEGDAIVPGINRVATKFEVVVTTQDWHPRDHGSFASNHRGAEPYDMGELGGRDQVLWPDHCVQGSQGAAFHPGLRVDARNFLKGTNPEADSYSGFYDDDGRSTGLDEFLKEKGATEVYVCGLATDFCVKLTALDALKQGYETVVIEDLSRAVNLNPDDGERALQELRAAGARVLLSTQLK
jgi:nicotinamidase/pyrazinamidase